MTDAELLQKLEEIFRENFDDGTITLTPATGRTNKKRMCFHV